MFNNTVVYGYAMAADKKNEVLACLGRDQVSACYVVTIEFGDAPFSAKKYAAAASLLAFVGLCPFVVLGYRGRRTIASKIPKAGNQPVAIGCLLFDKDQKQLLTSTETLKLTSKETRLLAIFAQNPNEVIDRARLQKESGKTTASSWVEASTYSSLKLRKKLGIGCKCATGQYSRKRVSMQISVGKI